MRCDEDVRWAAAVEALGALGEHAAVYAPAIAALLQDGDDEDVRWAAVEALGGAAEDEDERRRGARTRGGTFGRRPAAATRCWRPSTSR